MNLTFIWNFLTCSVTGAVDGAGHAYPSGSPDVTSVFFVEVHTVTCASVFCVVSFMCIFRLCALLFLCTPPFLSFSCVLSRVCLVFGFCSFFNNPFTLFRRYYVADKESSDKFDLNGTKVDFAILNIFAHVCNGFQDISQVFAFYPYVLVLAILVGGDAGHIF